jgi:hypothetical protein
MCVTAVMESCAEIVAIAFSQHRPSVWVQFVEERRKFGSDERIDVTRERRTQMRPPAGDDSMRPRDP